MEQKIIFSNSYSPRTGHNFAAEVFKVIVDAEVLIHDRSETKLTTILDLYYYIYDSKIAGQKDKKFIDELFINDLRKKITKHSQKKYIIIKDTSFIGVNEIRRVFPNDIQILIIRDPKAVLSSLFKGMSKKNTFKNVLKKVGYFIGLYPLYYALLLSYKQLKTLPDLDKYNVIKYEDLVMKDKTSIIKLKKLFGSNKSIENIIDDIDKIKVINTSFINETGSKKIWDAKIKTDKFNPINRKSQNWLVRTCFLIGSYPLRKKLGYIN